MISATLLSMMCDGVLNFNVFLGRSFSSVATSFSRFWVCGDKSVFFGKYCRIRLLVFSFVPRCQGHWGSQKYTGMPISLVKSACFASSMPRSQVKDFLYSMGIFLNVASSAWWTDSASLPASLRIIVKRDFYQLEWLYVCYLNQTPSHLPSGPQTSFFR